MALRASEILLILRAKNQASMTIRRVAKDVQFLGRTIKANQPGFDMLGRGRRAASQGAAMTHLGGAGALAGGATLLGLGAASKQFADFDKMASQAATQIGNINNSVEDVVANTGRLRNEILDMMGDFPATAQEMSGAAFEIFSSADVGFTGGIKLLELFNQTAVAGMTDLETATSGAMTVLNNFGDPAGPIGQSRDLMNDMFSIIRFGRVDLATLNTMMNQIAPAAAAADQSLSDVGGAIAVLTRRLGPGIASAGLARLFEIFQRRDFQEGMRKAGLAITDAQGQLLPLEEILARLTALGAKPGKDLQNLIQTVTAFGAGEGQGVQATVQARRALVTLLKNYEDYVDIQGRSIRNNNQFFKQLAAQQESLGVRWETFTNRLRANILRIGEDAIPIFEDIGENVEPLIDAWEGLDSQTKSTIVTLTGSAAVFALVGGAILGVAGVIRGLYGLLVMTSAVLGGRLIVQMREFYTWMNLIATQQGGLRFAMEGIRGMAARVLSMASMPAIAIGFTLAFQGDGWKGILGQALIGAGVGAQFGPAGAIIGAITVPIVLKIIDDVTGDDDASNPLNRLKTQLEELPVSQLQDMLKMPANAGEEVQRAIRESIAAVKRRNQAISSTLPEGSLTEIAAEAAKNVIPRTGEDVVRGIKAVTKKVGDATKKGMFANAKNIDQLNAQVAKQLKDNNKTLEDWAEQRADVLRSATEEQQSIVDQAVSTLQSTYDEFQQMNTQAMGELFSGPWLTSETFNLAEEWGITPAIQDLNRDLREQIAAFNDWQRNLRAIGQRGAPAELLQSLEALGPDAVDKLEVLRKASPKMFAEFVRLWKSRQNAIKRETEIDFSAQLKQWNQYGKDIAFQIITGLRSENPQLQAGFERYITKNFGGALQKVKDEALAEFYRENPEARKAEKQAAAIKRAGAARAAQIRQGDKTTITIHQQPGESGPAFAKRVAWETQRRKGRAKVVGKPRKSPAKAENATSAAKRPATVRGGN